MTEQAPHDTRHGHGYVPAMGHHRLLPWYDMVSRLAGVRALHRRLVDEADIDPGHQVLEIGCGTGNLALLVRRRHPDATVIGLDPDPLALARARRKAERRALPVHWDLGTAAELPYPDAGMDRVLSALMFHHLHETEEETVLREVRRVLRPGGRLHLVDIPGHRPGHFPWLTRRNARLPDDADDRIPARMRAAGLTDVVELGRGRFGTTFYRATR